MEKVSTTAKRLREYMDLTGLKQVDILERCKPYESSKCKITNPYLSQYLSGKFEPNPARLKILAKAMGVNEVWLKGYDVPMESETDPFRQMMFDDEDVLFDYDSLNAEQKAKLKEDTKKELIAKVKYLKSQEEDND